MFGHLLSLSLSPDCLIESNAEEFPSFCCHFYVSLTNEPLTFLSRSFLIIPSECPVPDPLLTFHQDKTWWAIAIIVIWFWIKTLDNYSNLFSSPFFEQMSRKQDKSRQQECSVSRRASIARILTHSAPPPSFQTVELLLLFRTWLQLSPLTILFTLALFTQLFSQLSPSRCP